MFRRKSCVTATPIEAKASDVLNQARNVRSRKASLAPDRYEQSEEQIKRYEEM